MAFRESYAGLSQAVLLAAGVTKAWSVKDIIAHVTTWEEEALKHLPAILEGRKPPRYSVVYGGIDDSGESGVRLRDLVLARWDRRARDETSARALAPENWKKVSRSLVRNLYTHFGRTPNLPRKERQEHQQVRARRALRRCHQPVANSVPDTQPTRPKDTPVPTCAERKFGAKPYEPRLTRVPNLRSAAHGEVRTLPHAVTRGSLLRFIGRLRPKNL
jgi:hypothetical protein